MKKFLRSFQDVEAYNTAKRGQEFYMPCVSLIDGSSLYFDPFAPPPVGPPANEIWYTSSDGNIVIPYRTSSLPEIDTNTYSDGKGVIKFKTDITSIGSSAFSDCTGLTSIEIPNSVTSIGNGAFLNCTGLTSIEIPNSVISIENQAFWNCTGLTSVYISDIDAWCAIRFLGLASSNPCAPNLYLNNTLVTDLVIPDSVTSIGNYTFQGCSGLTSVTIPSSVTSIGEWAFIYCTGLTSVTIPSSVTSIGGSAFGQVSGKILFTKLYSTYTNKILITPTSSESYTYNVEFNISEIPTDYNISSMLPNVADSGKGTLTYNIYTDYAPCKDQALALVTQKTIVNVYHIDGTPWE